MNPNRASVNSLLFLIFIFFKSIHSQAIGYKNTPVQANGQLSVTGVNLVNEKGVPIQLRGVATHGIQWFAGFYANGKALRAAAVDWDADVLRISIYLSEDGYLDSKTISKADFDAAIDGYIAVCVETGIYCILDWHIHHQSFPSYYQKEAKAFFERYAQKYSGVPNLIYEICNEPSNAGSDSVLTWQAIINYSREVIPVIRMHSPKAVVLVGTPGWSSLGFNVGRSVWREIVGNPVPFPDILYVIHPYVASHGWIDSLPQVADKLPLFATEWAASTWENNSKNDVVKAEKFVQFMLDRKIGWTYWNYSPGTSIFSAFDSTTNENGPFQPMAGNVTATGKLVSKWLREPVDAWGKRQTLTVTSVNRIPFRVWHPTVLSCCRADNIYELEIPYHDVSGRILGM